MSLSTEAKDIWTELLTEENVVGYIKLQTGQANVDFVTGTRGVDIIIDVDLIGIVANYDRDELAGTLIQQNDLRVTVDSTTAIIKTNKILVDGDEYRIVDLQIVNFAGILAGYVAQVRL